MSLNGGTGSDEPGTWIIKTSPDKSATVTADRWDYAEDGSLTMWVGQSIVAQFRWWDSLVRKGD